MSQSVDTSDSESVPPGIWAFLGTLSVCYGIAMGAGAVDLDPSVPPWPVFLLLGTAILISQFYTLSPYSDG